MSIVFSFFSAKGGVGKSVLSNLVCNELLFQALVQQKEAKIPKADWYIPKVLLVDIDRQNTNWDKRQLDIKYLGIKIGSPEYSSMHEMNQEKVRQCRKPYAILRDQYRYDPYNITPVNTSNQEEVVEVLKMICSGVYDFVVLDFPGNLDQEGMGQFFKLLDYMFIPAPVQGTTDLSGLVACLVELFNIIDTKTKENKVSPLPDLKQMKLVFNKVNPYDQKLCVYIENSILTAFPDRNLSFFNTRVKQLRSFDYNTLLPISVKIDQRDQIVGKSPEGESILSLVAELMDLFQKNGDFKFSTLT